MCIIIKTINALYNSSTCQRLDYIKKYNSGAFITDDHRGKLLDDTVLKQHELTDYEYFQSSYRLLFKLNARQVNEISTLEQQHSHPINANDGLLLRHILNKQTQHSVIKRLIFLLLSCAFLLFRNTKLITYPRRNRILQKRGFTEASHPINLSDPSLALLNLD